MFHGLSVNINWAADRMSEYINNSIFISIVKIVINIIIFGLIGACCFCSSADRFSTESMASLYSEKIKGISFVSINSIATLQNFRSAKDNSRCTWVSLMPFGFCKANENTVQFGNKQQWEGERSDGIKKYIDSAKACGLKIMLKPQIWFPNSFSGDFKCSTNEDWKVFEDSYWKYIKVFAEIAEKKKVDLFCVGTELRRFIAERPVFWEAMIDSIREYYSGQLTYASNWDNYQEIPFWNRLDLIGIDAYFPLADGPTATKHELKESFRSLAVELEGFSINADHQKIIFTEYGWRSSTGDLRKPWQSNTNHNVDLMIQKVIYEAFFEELWDESWFKGGFIWKWFPDHESSGGELDSRFTPQNKPAQKVIHDNYGR